MRNKYGNRVWDGWTKQELADGTARRAVALWQAREDARVGRMVAAGQIPYRSGQSQGYLADLSTRLGIPVARLES